MAIALGVASIFGMLVLATSSSLAMERMMRSGFGFADIQVNADQPEDSGKIAERISKLPGVKGVAIEKMAFVNDSKGRKTQFNIKAIDSENPMASRLYPLGEGRLPKSNKEIALPIELARDKRYRYRIGQTFPLPLAGGIKKLTIVGFIKSTSANVSSEVGVYVSAAFLGRAAAKGMFGNMSTISVVLKNGASQKRLATMIKKMDGVADVGTEESILKSIRQLKKQNIQFFGILGGISLVVGGVLMYTAFAIMATEREREFGLMKAVGATRRWARRLVYREAMLLGVLFSLLGICLGFILSYLLISVGTRPTTGVPMISGLDVSDLTVTPLVVAISLVAGIGTTLFSAFLPARRAATISPLSAIRPQPASEQKVSKARWVGVPVILVGAILFYWYTVVITPDDARFLIAIAGAVGVYLGLAIFMPIVIGPIFNLFERLSSWRLGAVSKLAFKSMGRQSVRSARTVTSILIGISLVFLVAIFTTGSVAQPRRIAEQQVKYEFVISMPQNQPQVSPIPKDVVRRVRKLSEVDQATGIGWGDVKAVKKDPHSSSDRKKPGPNALCTVNTLDPVAFPKVSKLFFAKGVDSDQAWEKLGGRYVFVSKPWADMIAKVKPGDTIEVFAKGDTPTEFKVLAYADGHVFGSHLAMGNIYMSQENARRFLNIGEDRQVLVKLKPGANRNVTRAKIMSLLEGTEYDIIPDTQIFTTLEKQSKGGAQGFFYPFFGVAVFISLLGVINVIAISVLERRREIGLIKAIGGTGKLVSLSIILEAVLISVTGTIIGMAISTGIAAIFNKAIHKDDIIPSVFIFPLEASVVLLAIVILVSVLGAIMPIRMAKKFTPVEALQFE